MKRRADTKSLRTVVVTLLAVACSASALGFHRTKVANPVLPPPGPGTLREVAVRDLPYGDALFYFYLGDFDTALERLTYADAMGRLPHHRDDARLLIGGMELSRGDYMAAASLFHDVLDRPNVPDNVRDRAHFYLGKTLYRRGYYAEAADNLGKAASGTLPPDFDAERRMLLAEAEIGLGEPDKAAAVLDHWDRASTWRSLAQFNLGVALVRSGQGEAGARVLDELGRAPAKGREALAIRDRANTALGFAYVQQHRPVDAVQALGRVRVDGADATRALLGAGWAAADGGNFREALASWLNLRERDPADPAVQESYLAVPYGYAQLGAEQQAVDGYERALKDFQSERLRLDAAIAAIRGGALRAALDLKDPTPPKDTGIETKDLPASRYLYRLLARDDVQAALSNWRDLGAVTRRLDARKTDLAAFADLLDYRHRLYAERLPGDLDKLDRQNVDALYARRTDLEARVAAADTHADLAELGTPRQRAIWQQLEQMEGVVDRTGNASDDEIDDIADRIEFLKGYLYFELSDGFKSRVWTARKKLRDLDRSLTQTTRSATLIKTARTKMPERVETLRETLSDLMPKIEALHSRAQALRDRALAHIADIAVRELEAEKLRIRDYELDARYSLATLYDRAATSAGDATGAKP